VLMTSRRTQLDIHTVESLTLELERIRGHGMVFICMIVHFIRTWRRRSCRETRAQSRVRGGY